MIKRILKKFKILKPKVCLFRTRKSPYEGMNLWIGPELMRFIVTDPNGMDCLDELLKGFRNKIMFDWLKASVKNNKNDS